MRNVRGCWLLIAVIMLLPGCNESKHEETSMMTTTQISGPEWQALEKSAWFSVTSLWGIIFLVALSVWPLGTASAAKGISHFLIGSNGDPIAKIRDFVATIDAGAAQGADIALMKLCYADFDATTDA